ncbi:MAG TPA: hypothetical protein VFU47_08825, partial [Armatimonadota bacterium]|nr:hypothetical protein [Armatimonadota bacterium]
LFDDVLISVTDDANYANKTTFDRNVFQKFIAVMFVNYATTDPLFYGTSREDYGVSSDKDMQETPLYQAVKSALRHLERGVEYGSGARFETPEPAAPEPAFTEDLSSLFQESGTAEEILQPFQGAHTVEIPLGAEGMLMQPLSRLAEAVRLLRMMDHPRAVEIRGLAANAGQQLFRTLQEMKVLSPLARDPIKDALED